MQRGRVTPPPRHKCGCGVQSQGKVRNACDSVDGDFDFALSLDDDVLACVTNSTLDVKIVLSEFVRAFFKHRKLAGHAAQRN